MPAIGGAEMFGGIFSHRKAIRKKWETLAEGSIVFETRPDAYKLVHKPTGSVQTFRVLQKAGSTRAALEVLAENATVEDLLSAYNNLVVHNFEVEPKFTAGFSEVTATARVAEQTPIERQCAELRAKIRFLESQLHADKPYSRLYNLGAGSLFAAVISLTFWALTGVGVPFHPIFAAATVPASVGLIIMAFLTRGKVSNTEGK